MNLPLPPPSFFSSYRNFLASHALLSITSLDSHLNSTLSLCYFQAKFIHPISILPLFPPISYFCLAQSHHSPPPLVYSGTFTMPFSKMCGNHVRYYGNTTYNFNTFSHPLHQSPPFINAYISPPVCSTHPEGSALPFIMLDLFFFFFCPSKTKCILSPLICVLIDRLLLTAFITF